LSRAQTDPRRKWSGQKLHYDEKWNFSFFVPLDWVRYDLTNQYGVMYTHSQDPRICFYVSVQDLSEVLDKPVTQADLPALREGALEGLWNLADCQIIYEKEITKESAFGFEFMSTFTLDGELCKRRVFLLYKGLQQFTIYGQVVPADEYEIFHDMLGYMYTVFTFKDLRALIGKLEDLRNSVQM